MHKFWAICRVVRGQTHFQDNRDVAGMLHALKYPQSQKITPKPRFCLPLLQLCCMNNCTNSTNILHFQQRGHMMDGHQTVDFSCSPLVELQFLLRHHELRLELVPLLQHLLQLLHGEPRSVGVCQVHHQLVGPGVLLWQAGQ